MLTGNKTTVVYTCEGCKEEYTDPTVAEACEKSHADSACQHKTWAYTTVTGSGIMQRACLGCQFTQLRAIPIDMDLWPLLKD